MSFIETTGYGMLGIVAIACLALISQAVLVMVGI